MLITLSLTANDLLWKRHGWDGWNIQKNSRAIPVFTSTTRQVYFYCVTSKYQCYFYNIFVLGNTIHSWYLGWRVIKANIFLYLLFFLLLWNYPSGVIHTVAIAFVCCSADSFLSVALPSIQSSWLATCWNRYRQVLKTWCYSWRMKHHSPTLNSLLYWSWWAVCMF